MLPLQLLISVYHEVKLKFSFPVCQQSAAFVLQNSTLRQTHLVKYSINTFVWIYVAEMSQMQPKLMSQLSVSWSVIAKNLSYRKSSVSWGEITDQKWKCHCGISSQLTGPSYTWAQGFSAHNIFWKNPLHTETACLICWSSEYADNIFCHREVIKQKDYIIY